MVKKMSRGACDVPSGAEKTRDKSGSLLMKIGLALIAAALLLAVYNLWDDQRAGKSVDRVLDAMPELVKTAGVLDPSIVQEITYPDYVLYPDMEMPSLDVDGNRYIGIISIPSLGKELPVLSEWSYPNLKTAPCRYAGTAYKEGFVICAHNYTRHFGGMRGVQEGSLVCFTDIDGNVFNYTVDQVEQVDPDNAAYMLSDEWDLTLFTCTLGGQFRTAVRCVTAEPSALELAEKL